MDDQELLGQFVSSGSPQAFAELVRVHADMVYASARRQMGRADLAEEVTQAVFILLAKKAEGIKPGQVTGWLMRATHFACRDAKKLMARREFHEKRAAEMRGEEIPPAREENWREYAPLLDDALARLRKKDRDAVSLRFFRGLNFGDVGRAMGISEEAARKRVDRGIARLRATMAGKAVVPGAAVLMTQLATHGVEAAPAHLVQTIAATALTAIVKGTFVWAIARKASHSMTWMKIKVAAIIIVGVALTGLGAGKLVALAGEHQTPPPNTAAVSPVVSAAATAPSADGNPGGLTRISLHVKDADARDVLRQIASQANTSMTLWPESLWSGAFGQAGYRVTMNLDNVPFWKAVEQLCAATQSDPIAIGNSKGITISNGFSKGSAFSGIQYQSGVFTIVANMIQHNHASYLVDGSTERNDVLSMQVYVDPKCKVLGWQQWAVLDVAEDDHGVSMLPDKPPTSGLNPPFICDWGFQPIAFLKFPPRPGKRLSRLSGHFDAKLLMGTTPFAIDDVAHSVGKSIHHENYTLKLDSYSSNNGKGSIRVSVTEPQGILGRSEHEEGMMYAMLLDRAIFLMDAEGKTLSLSAEGGVVSEPHYSVNFGSGPILKDPIKLIWNFPSDIKTMTVPFEFKDLPLPEE